MDLYMLHMDVLRACWRFQKGSSSDSVGKAKQSKAKQSKAKQSKAKQSKAIEASKQTSPMSHKKNNTSSPIDQRKSGEKA